MRRNVISLHNLDGLLKMMREDFIAQNPNNRSSVLGMMKKIARQIMLPEDMQLYIEYYNMKAWLNKSVKFDILNNSLNSKLHFSLMLIMRNYGFNKNDRLNQLLKVYQRHDCLKEIELEIKNIKSKSKDPEILRQREENRKQIRITYHQVASLIKEHEQKTIEDQINRES